MKKLSFVHIIALLVLAQSHINPVLASDVGFFVRADCGTLDPVANATFCLQSTTTSGRTAGISYVWDGGSWIASTGSGSGDGHQIEDEGSAITQRSVLNFVGAGVTAADSGGKSTVTINAGSGTVTSVAFSVPTQYSITGSPITTSGTLALGWQNQTANLGLFGPSSGSAAAPTFRAMVKDDTPATTVHEDQSNTYTTGTQDFRNVTKLYWPVAGGIVPTDSGDCGYSSTTNTYRCGNAGNTEDLVYQSVLDGWSVTALDDLDTDFAPSIYVKGEQSAGAPAAGSCDRAMQVQFDTTNKKVYGCFGAGENAYDVGLQSDSHNAGSNGTETFSATGSETIFYGVSTTQTKNIETFSLATPTATAGTSGGPFSVQPDDDGVEFVSSSAGDTQTCKIYGNTFGADTSAIIVEEITMNGVTPVPTVKTDWGKIRAVRCASVAVGTITVREASGNVTITVIAAGGTQAANQDTVLVKAASGGSSTKTTTLPFRFETVEIGAANATIKPTDGTNFDYAGINYADSVTGKAFFSIEVPADIAATPAWNLVISSKAVSGAGGDVSLGIYCRAVAHNEALDSTMAYVFGASGNPAEKTILTSANLTKTTVSATDLDGTLAIAAGDSLYCGIDRVAGDANDTINAAWLLLRLSLQVDVNS